jgi:hypothetical protein
MAAAAAPAAAQIPLPPLPPPAEPPPPDGSRPDPEQPGPPVPQPVSETPGSVASRVDVGHSGSLPSESLVPPLRQRWSVPMSAVSILAAEGRVFAAGGTLTAFDQATGKTVWSVPLQGRPDGAVYDAGMIFVIVGDDLQAYSAGDGSLVWQHRGHRLHRWPGRDRGNGVRHAAGEHRQRPARQRRRQTLVEAGR